MSTLPTREETCRHTADALGAADPSAVRAVIGFDGFVLRTRLGLSTVVIHSRRGAAAATIDSGSASIEGPFVRQPVVTTGAGDHFNAGFSLGLTLDLDLSDSLCCVAAAGYYVSRARTPSYSELVAFVARLPTPEVTPAMSSATATG